MINIKKQGGWVQFIPAIAAAAGSAFQQWSGNRQAKRQMEFQERMSSTAHQRQVEDLRLAGLNPILSAGGSGASTPSGAMSTPPNIGSAAAAGMAQGSQIQLAQAQTAKTTADTNTVEYWKSMARSAGMPIDEYISKFKIDISQPGEGQLPKSAKEVNKLTKYKGTGFERKTSRPKHTFKSKWTNPLKGRGRRKPTYKDNPFLNRHDPAYRGNRRKPSYNPPWDTAA